MMGQQNCVVRQNADLEVRKLHQTIRRTDVYTCA